MTRRVRLPGADELFRTTTSGAVLRPASPAGVSSVAGATHAEDRLRAVPSTVDEPEQKQQRGAARRSTGRQRHDEKITVYVSPEELLDLEKVRIMLRAEYGLVVDRGRIVREAIALLLGDLEDNEADSALITRLRDC
jgi:hypothetical protein